MRVLICALVASVLSGCASTTYTPLYQWEGYETQVYQHLKSPDAAVSAQIATLEQDLQKIRAANGSPPPGYQAHLGLLYLSTGASEKAMVALNAESAAFPEFAPYMNFLLTQRQKK